jgi:CRP-like cAMP-binding protein
LRLAADRQDVIALYECGNVRGECQMLSVEEKAEALAKGVFSGLDEAARRALAERMGEVEFAGGETLFLEGEPGSEVYVLVSGEVEIRREGAVVAVLGPGQLMGEMAVLGSGKRTATGVARGSVKLLFLKDKAIRLLIQQVPDIAFAIFGVLIDRLSDASELVAFLSGDREQLGRVEVASGDIAGQSFPILRTRAVLGKAQGSAVADGLRLALPTEDEGVAGRHAAVTIEEGAVFIEPVDGEVTVNGTPVAGRIAVGPEDVISVGGLGLRFHLDDSRTDRAQVANAQDGGE